MKIETCQFEASRSQLSSILKWVREQIKPVNLSDKEKKKVELAMEEAIINVINHGTLEGSFQITLTFQHDINRHITFELKDPTEPFNPLTFPKPNIEQTSLEEMELGGVGISLMKKCMDALFYRRENGYNILTLVKNLHKD